jgi:alpha-L-fucosidase
MVSKMILGVLVAMSLPAASWLFADSPGFQDNGIVEPYVPPKEHREYVSELDAALVPTLKAHPAMVEQWQDGRFGVFMHWDPSCQVTGSTSWARHGRRPHHSSDGTVTKGIDNDLYNNQYKTFNPVKFDADQWARMIKASGAEYFVFTAKHHQGFCMFDSAVTDYDIMNTPFGRDVCKELADACHKHDIKLFFYYSQPDWTERRYYADYPSAEFDRYVDEFLFPQLRELATGYGKLGGIWFDGLGKHPDTWRTPAMLRMLRDLQPQMVFNHRCAPRPWRFGDFDGPEGEIGRFQTNRPWETCTKMGGAWGWSGHGPAMSLADCVGLLVRCAGNGGNLLLNTGPAPDGTINPRHVERYLQMGAWLEQFGESIYATRGGPYKPGPWGCATRSKDKNTIYLHILSEWEGVISLPDLSAKVVANRVLSGGTATVTQADGQLTVAIDPDERRGRAFLLHDFDTVIALELEVPAMTLPILDSVGPSLTVGAKADASSETDSDRTAQSLVASDLTEFSEGIFVKQTWSPDSHDEDPWVQLDLAAPTEVSQIAIQEGKYGSVGSVQAFTISLRVDGKWTTVYQGEKIGGSFGVILPNVHIADSVRLEFQRWEGRISINQINAYGSPQKH